MAYTQHTLSKMNSVKELGFNIFAMLHLFRKRSKLNQEVPNDVVSAVCDEYLRRHRLIRKDFPYFLQILERKTREYFAMKEVNEAKRIKNLQIHPSVKNILLDVINKQLCLL